MADKRPSKSKDSIESYARPFLPTIVDQVLKDGNDPCEIVLLVPKYDRSRSCVVPRSRADEAMRAVRTPVAQDKIRRLLDLPCAQKQLLVVVTAGEHVEGKLVGLPTLAPPPGKVFLTQRELEDIEAYQARHAPLIAAQVANASGRLADHVAILRMPDDSPLVLTRDAARRRVDSAGFGEAAKELDVPPRSDGELLCLYMVKGKGSWSRLDFSPASASGPPAKNVHALAPSAHQAASLSSKSGKIETRKQLEDYIAVLAPQLLTRAEKEGWRLADYVAILRLPNTGPVFLPRVDARHGLAASGYAEVAPELDAPAPDNELLLLYRFAGKQSWARVTFGPVGEDQEMIVLTRERLDARAAISPQAKEAFGRSLVQTLGKAMQRALDEGKRLADLVAIYEPGEDVALLPRAVARKPLLALGYASLLRHLDEPSEEHDMLTFFKVNGAPQWNRIRAAVGNELPARDASPQALQDAFIRRSQDEGYRQLRAAGLSPNDFCMVVSVPSDGRPRIMRRRVAGERLASHVKYKQIVSHLRTECDDLMVFVDVAELDDIIVQWRDASMLPNGPFAAPDRPFDIDA